MMMIRCPEYLVKQRIFGSMDASQSLGQIPIIDINLFSSSSLDSKLAKNELENLRSALSSSGCFQAVGHGISSSFLDKVREAGTQLSVLSSDEKQKYLEAAHEQVHDWCYRLTLRVFPEDKRILDLWPESPYNFRELLEEYATNIKFMIGTLFKAMAKSLNLKENSFADQLFGDQALMTAQFNFYPQCSRADQVFGVKPHTDGSGITVLLQDKEVEGLQVLVDDNWVRVPIVPHALVVNLGDQMQIMSNGIFKSAMHRVVTNSEKSRLSVAMFNLPDPDTEIGPLESLIHHHETRPRLYKNVKNYGRINYKCYQRGEIGLETVQM